VQQIVSLWSPLLQVSPSELITQLFFHSVAVFSRSDSRLPLAASTAHSFALSHPEGNFSLFAARFYGENGSRHPFHFCSLNLFFFPPAHDPCFFLVTLASAAPVLNSLFMPLFRLEGPPLIPLLNFSLRYVFLLGREFVSFPLKFLFPAAP